MAVFTVPPTLQSFGDVVAQKFERPESRALPTFDSAEAGKTAPKTAFRSLELAVPTHSSPTRDSRADLRSGPGVNLNQLAPRDTARVDRADE